MSLVAGTRLGPYEIQSAIGAGGMGEVYKARDTRLDRTVAIKVLPAELSADPDRRVRFEREARAVAALSHPHICTLYDIGSHDGTTYLVMEHLAGESLAERLLRGPVPLAQALDIAAQIADALDAAHKHGIIHRDLKPGNVMLTPGSAGRSGVTTSKLLDFGLAKLTAHGERPALVADGATAPTMAAPFTARGTILGTLQYMAPEQLEGKEADARTDLWALGALLYEMVTGRRAFQADSDVSLIGAILNTEPAPLPSLQPVTPPALDRLVRKCLAKHPDDRWDSAHDVADELRWISAGSAAPIAAGARRPWRAVGVGASLLAVLVATAAAVSLWLFRPARPAPAVVRALLDVAPAEELNAGGVLEPVLTPGGSRTALAVTPDGRALVFAGRRGGVQQLFVRELDRNEAKPLPGTEGAQLPVVSADGDWVAFWASGAIRKVPLAGGPPSVLVEDVPWPPFRIAWSATGQLLYEVPHPLVGTDSFLICTALPGSPPRVITTLGRGELQHVLPQWLPDGAAFLYTVRSQLAAWGDERVVVQRLASGERTTLVEHATDARVVPTGHLVFMRLGALTAVPFDAQRWSIAGDPIAVVADVAQALTDLDSEDVSGAGQFAVSADGLLAYLPGPVAPYPEGRLVAVNRRGVVTPLAAPIRNYSGGVRLSPDRTKLSVTIRELTGRRVWILDLNRGALTPLTPGGEAWWPTWTPDGSRIAFLLFNAGAIQLVWQPADGSSPPEMLGVPATASVAPAGWTPDGEELVLAGWDVGRLTLRERQLGSRPVIQTPATEFGPALSPDGRWVAYSSNTSGRPEVYLQTYPDPGPRVQLSVEGGSDSAWNPNGRELFFVGLPGAAGTRDLMAVGVGLGSPLKAESPRRLFEFRDSELRFSGNPERNYDVAADGQRFFLIQRVRPPSVPRVTHINLVQNWFEELKAKVPAGGAK